MARPLILASMMLALAVALPAQERWRPPSVEVRPFAGAFVPVGAQRADFESAPMVGVQTAIEAN